MKAHEYRISPSDYLKRSLSLLEDIENQKAGREFFYCALEMRFAIEQTLRSYLLLVGIDSWSKTMEKLYSAKDIKQRLLSMEPEFYDKLEFVSLCTSSIGLPEVYPLDLDKLNVLYGRIGGYLHAQAREEESVADLEWWQSFKDLLNDAGQYVLQILSHAMAHIDLDLNGNQVYRDWKEGNVSDDEVQEQFRSSIPPEHLQALHAQIRQ